MSDSTEIPTPQITDHMIRWMSAMLERDKQLLRPDDNRGIEQQAMSASWVSGRWSILEELKRLNQLQKGQDNV